jgi:hypothetical protein
VKGRGFSYARSHDRSCGHHNQGCCDDHNLRDCWSEKAVTGWQLVRAARRSLVRGKPSFERDVVVSYVFVAPPLVAVTVVSSSPPVFLAKRPVAVDTDTFWTVGVGFGL